MEDSLLSTTKKSSSQSSAIDDSAQYNNISLNQSRKFSKLDLNQSKSNSSVGSKHQNDNSVDYQLNAKSDLNSWNKNDTILKSFDTSNFRQNKELKSGDSKFQNNDNLSKNNSTLSLHISAHENSVEASSIEKSETDKFDNKPFGFPLQQNHGPQTPSLTQLKTSQKLLNLNKVKKRLTPYDRTAETTNTITKTSELLKLVREWTIFKDLDRVSLETFLNRSRKIYPDNNEAWKLLIIETEKRFVENKNEILTFEDRELVKLQRVVDPTFCTAPARRAVIRDISVPVFEYCVDGENREVDSPVREEHIDTTLLP